MDGVRSVFVIDPTSRATPVGEERYRAEVATGGKPHRGNETLAFHENFVEIRVISNGQGADDAAAAVVAPPRLGDVCAAGRATW